MKAHLTHRLDAIAITDGEICSIDFARIQSLMKTETALQKSIERAMSTEIFYQLILEA